MRVYVVSKHFDRIDERNLEDALGLLYLGKARVLSFSDKTLSISHRPRYDLDPEFRAVMRGWDAIQIPHAIVLKSGNSGRRPTTKAITRKNLHDRDGWVCQFDGCNNNRDLTIDHVYPRSRFKTGEFSGLPFGVKSWENLVTACQPCNGRKGDRTPEEAGMRLKKPPTAPLDIIPPELWNKVFPQEQKGSELWEA